MRHLIRRETNSSPARVLRAGLAVLAVLVGTVLLPAGVAAGENDTFGVVPDPMRVDGVERRTFEVPLEVGQVFEDAVSIYNRTDDVVHLAVYPAEAAVGADDVVAIGFRGAQPQGLASWITVDRSMVELPPRGEESVKFRIRIRDDEPDPELAAIVVENTAEETGEGVDVVQRIAILIRSAPAGTPTAADRLPEGARPLWLLWLLLVPATVLAVFLWKRRRRTHDASAEDTGDIPVEAPVLSPEAVALVDREHEPVATLAVEEDKEPDEPPPVAAKSDQEPSRPRKKPAAQTQRRKPKRPSGRNYIPLDEL